MSIYYSEILLPSQKHPTLQKNTKGRQIKIELGLQCQI